MGLWDTIKQWVSANSARQVYLRIPKGRTDMTGADDAFAPYKTYFRVWVSDLFLTKSRSWGVDLHPAVNATVRLNFAGREAVSFNRVARPPAAALSKGVFVRFPVTELMPYGGGVTEIEAALIALTGNNQLAAALDVLQGFSGLVGAPLEQALTIADMVSSGVAQLFNVANGQIHLSWHDAFTSGGGATSNPLRPGYFAVILTEGKPVAPSSLCVIDGQLHVKKDGGGASAPFQSHDYMLFFIEGRTERDDYRIRSIQEPLDKAIAALAEGNTDKAEAYKRVALGMALTSPDLAVQDRRRVALAIKEELDAITGAGLGAKGEATSDLNVIVERSAMKLERALMLGELTAAELFQP